MKGFLIMKIEPGIYEGVSFDDYCKWEAINNSSLKVLNEKSALHYKHYTENGREETEPMKIGSALHTKILEPGSFGERYIVVPDVDRRKKKGKEIYEEAEKDGRSLVKQSELDMINAIIDNLRAKNVARLFGGVKIEICIVWIDKITDLLCKARIDFWRPDFNYIGDIKSTRDASKKQFARDVIRYLYNQQAAFYTDGMEALTMRAPKFYLCPVEKEPPFDSAAYELQADEMLAGRKSYRKALITIKKCQESGIWPGYCQNGVEPLYLPDWYLKENGVNEFDAGDEI